MQTQQAIELSNGQAQDVVESSKVQNRQVNELIKVRTNRKETDEQGIVEGEEELTELEELEGQAIAND